MALRRSNLIVGVIFLVFIAACLVASLQIKAPASGSDPGPAAYPQFVLALLAVCAIGLILTPADNPEASQQRRWPMVVAVFAMLAGYVLLLAVLGYLLATICFVAGMVLLSGERRWPVLTVYALVLPLGLYYIFSGYLNIALPFGVLEAILP